MVFPLEVKCRWVSDVLVQDCKAAALLHGMQIKGTKDRGGYVKNVTVKDCELLQITIFPQSITTMMASRPRRPQASKILYLKILIFQEPD